MLGLIYGYTLHISNTPCHMLSKYTLFVIRVYIRPKTCFWLETCFLHL